MRFEGKPRAKHKLLRSKCVLDGKATKRWMFSLSGQAAMLGQPNLQNHMAIFRKKKILRATASHETDLSSKQCSRCSAALMLDLCFHGRISRPAQHSVTLACVFRGGSMFCADAMGCVAHTAFSATGCVTFVAGVWARHARSPQRVRAARALRYARSPQRVRRAPDTFVRRHSQSASTCTTFAEGSLSSRTCKCAKLCACEYKHRASELAEATLEQGH